MQVYPASEMKGMSCPKCLVCIPCMSIYVSHACNLIYFILYSCQQTSLGDRDEADDSRLGQMDCFSDSYDFLLQVWELVYSKDGSVKEVSKAMQLKGHKVVYLCTIAYDLNHVLKSLFALVFSFFCNFNLYSCSFG